MMQVKQDPLRIVCRRQWLGAIAWLAGGCLALAGEAENGWETAEKSNAKLGLRTDVVEMRGVWTNGVGHVVWRMGGTWGTAGFHVYRVDAASGAETRLTETLVPVAFHDPAAVYEVVDPAASEGGTGCYRLEETEMAGAIIDLGAQTVVFAPPSAGAAPVAPRAKSAPSARRPC